jgi:eukaryotic-like serine/threonine-protein kinase
MATTPKVIYEFGPFRVDPDRQLLFREEQALPITPKALETLLVLVRNPRETVSKDKLMEAVWPDAFVEEANLVQNIFLLRKLLGDTAEDRRYIVTAPGRGYRFAEEVRTITQSGPDVLVSSHSISDSVVQQVAGETDVARVAHGISGTKPRQLLRVFAVASVVALVLLGAGLYFFRSRSKGNALAETGSILLADFANTTGDEVFDGTLRRALAIELEQSPILSIVPAQQMQQGLQMMGQDRNAAVTPAIAQQLCLRTGSAAALDGSIALIGSQYLVTLRAVNCSTGKTIASEQANAVDKNQVLAAIDKIAAEMRNRLGESLASIQKFDIPLKQATTSSLEALKAFSTGDQVTNTNGYATSIPLFKRAIELDPDFALAYSTLGIGYWTLRENILASQCLRKAFDLRGRVSDFERLAIESQYYFIGNGDLEKYRKATQLWVQTYPRAAVAHGSLQLAYSAIGQYDKAMAEGLEVLRLEPQRGQSYSNVAITYIRLNRVADAVAVLQEAEKRKLDYPVLHRRMYLVAFLQNDAAGMARQLSWSEANPGVDNFLLSYDSDTAAYGGRLGLARAETDRAVASAKRSGQMETAASHEANAAWREALLGNISEARQRVAAALALSKGRDILYETALALGITGDEGRVRSAIEDLNKRYPEDTLVQFEYIPVFRAQNALHRRDANGAISDLATATPYEEGDMGAFSMYPIFLRAQAYRLAKQPAQAVIESQKILDRPGLALSSPIAALSLLEQARAYAEASDVSRAREKYQDFFHLWANADPGIGILRDARLEFAKLK